MAIPLLRIGLAVLFLAFCNVAESLNWTNVIFRAILDDVKQCVGKNGLLELAPAIFGSLPPGKDVDAKELQVAKWGRQGFNTLRPVITEDGDFGLLLEQGSAGSPEQLEEGDLFTQTTCRQISGDVPTWSYKEVLYRNSLGYVVQLSVHSTGKIRRLERG
eukprot:GHVS01038399.1.p1 GENE.GHVS01038399.1~~GHVS01038399.1.p1  ORF type:complete len:160 (+),score=3.31 GHVS01038399.1:77-556(+)